MCYFEQNISKQICFTTGVFVSCTAVIIYIHPALSLQSARDIIAFKIVLDEKGINTDDVFDDVLVQAKTDLEEAKRDKEDLVAQLEEVFVGGFKYFKRAYKGSI